MKFSTTTTKKSLNTPLLLSSNVKPNNKQLEERNLPIKSNSNKLISFFTLSQRLVLILSLITFIPLINAAPYEPAGNAVLFGAWIDTQVGFNDTPSNFNKRINHNVPVYQIAQEIPLPKYNYTTGAGGPAPENLIEESETDAAVFLTVYPYVGFAAVSNADFVQLGEQILAYQTTLQRTVFLRYAPEMQGNWNIYGQQPTAFNQSWHQMWSTVSQIAPGPIFVWAPNTPQGYPYGETFATSSLADIALLDTNGDGELSAADNALDPYYPGDAVVDWIGLSLYYKGSQGDTTNFAQLPGYCGQAINGIDPGTGNPLTANWYEKYCLGKPDKACMFSESGAAYHVNGAGTATQLAIQQAWISDCITNTTFYDTFSRIKMVMQFEFMKNETANEGGQDLRDFRITNNTQVLSQFISDLDSSGMNTRFSWANSRAPPTSISSPGAPPPTSVPSGGNSDGSNTSSTSSGQVVIITATTRPRDTSFPSLFGKTSDGGQREEIIELSIMILCALTGGWVVMRNL